MLRPVLVHDDFDVRNVLVKDGVVSRIVDWEVWPILMLSHHYMTKLILASKRITLSYLNAWRFHIPSFISFMRIDGIYDPNYGLHARNMPTQEWWVTASEIKPLRAAFRGVYFYLRYVALILSCVQAAGKILADYVRALGLGEDLRRLLELAVDSFVACDSWERDMSKSLSSV